MKSSLIFKLPLRSGHADLSCANSRAPHLPKFPTVSAAVEGAVTNSLSWGFLAALLTRWRQQSQPSSEIPGARSLRSCSARRSEGLTRTEHDCVREWHLAELLQAAGKSKREMAFLRGLLGFSFNALRVLGPHSKYLTTGTARWHRQLGQLSHQQWPLGESSSSIHNLWF